uniref:U5-Saltitoxin-Pre1a_1 n=1 Tax=Phidippus regius TaxID=1905328 RepID=A0A482Z8Y2_9ARAC
MKATATISFLFVALLFVTMVESFNAEEIEDSVVPEERGYCAERGIKCNDIHCCTGLKCKCKNGDCVCRKG